MLQRLRCQDSELKFKDAKIEKITFQLARLKAWKFGAKTEAMRAEQRRLFQETWSRTRPACRLNWTSCPARLRRRSAPATMAKSQTAPQPLPEHLRREEHHHEPADTNCPNPSAAAP
jgi:transposase